MNEGTPGQISFCLKSSHPAPRANCGVLRRTGRSDKPRLDSWCIARHSPPLPTAPRAAQLPMLGCPPGTRELRLLQHFAAETARKNMLVGACTYRGVVSPLRTIRQRHGPLVVVSNRRKREPKEKGQKPWGVWQLSEENESGALMLAPI